MSKADTNPNLRTMRSVSNSPPAIKNLPDDKFERMLFLPPNEQRKGEGGLRLQGYSKTSGYRGWGEGGVASTETHPLITVITVVFNGAETLERSILSVINQNYDNVEYIIIDGGSTDGTQDIIRKYEHAIDYWVSEPDVGIYDAFNKAVKCSSGDWVCFMGADDYLWDENVLDYMAPTMLLAMPSFNLVYGSVAIVDAQQHLIFRVGESWKIAKRKLGDIMSIPHPGLMHHRTWFEKYGLFDTSFRIAGDYEMLLRGWPHENALFIPDCIVVAMGQGGVSSSPENSIRALSEIRRAQKTHGILFPSARLLVAFLNIYIRFGLQKLLGERKAYQLVDFGRKLFGKHSYWTRL